MRILFLTSGPRVPSTRYRVLQFLPGLRERGHECVVAHSRPAKYRGWPWLGNRLSDGPRIVSRLVDRLRYQHGRFDVVFLERELFSNSIGWLEPWFRSLAPAFVLDVDDAIFLSHPEKFARNAGLASVVTCGNGLLAERVTSWNSSTAIVPTCLDLARYEVGAPGTDPETVVLGWTGTAANIPYLSVLEDPLSRLSREHRIELRVVAESRAPLDSLDFGATAIRFVPWRESSEIADLHGFDIGLAPLPDDDWTRFKCGLKVLQSMAIGVPVVASPVGVHTEIVTSSDTGLLADTADAWFECLRQLVRDVELRRRLGCAGRVVVENGYSVAGWLPRLERILEDAANRS